MHRLQRLPSPSPGSPSLFCSFLVTNHREQINPISYDISIPQPPLLVGDGTVPQNLERSKNALSKSNRSGPSYLLVEVRYDVRDTMGRTKGSWLDLNLDWIANDSEGFLNALKRACEAVVEAEPEITRQDVIAGDGDAGLTLRSGAEGESYFR
jgi:hypothetical protein